MNKGKKSLYSALTAITLAFVNGLLGLVVTRLVIANYGSDFNGLNSTANQMINMLLIIEGGFTLATNVALFKPLAERDYDTINNIMAATKIIFFRIGTVFLTLGILLSVGYAMVIKSDLPVEIAILTFLMTVISTAFNLLYATKYQIILQTEQREYILNSIKIGTIILSQSLIIGVVFLQGHMLLIRFVTMMGTIINSLLIGYACKKNYKYLDFNVLPNYTAIKGTKDVFAQKVTSVIYGAVPIIFISATVGTMFASVYAVYNSVFTLLKSVLYSLVNAPRMGFGQLIAEKDKNYVFIVFIQYEYIVITAMLCFLTTAAVLIMPFINLYTAGLDDINYSNRYVAILLVCITFFEVIHIPSGNIINVSGNFRTSKKFQIIACITLVVFMIIGGKLIGFYGILLAVLITAILLAVIEIVFIHKVYFKKPIITFFRLLIPNTVFSIVLVYIEILLLPSVLNSFQFIVAGFVLIFINSISISLLNLLVNKRVTIEVVNRLLPLSKRFIRN